MHLPQKFSHFIKINKCCSTLSTDFYVLKSFADNILRNKRKVVLKRMRYLNKICAWKMTVFAKKENAYSLFCKDKICVLSNNLEYALEFAAS